MDTEPEAAAGDPVDVSVTRSMMPNVRDLGPNIVVAGVFPFVGYLLLRPHVSSDVVALAMVMVFPVAEVGYERRRRGRFEPIGIIALVGIVLGIVGAVVTGGNATLLKIRESAVTGVFGLVCLCSLPARRPLMWHFGKAFATGGDPVKAAAFDEIWTFPGSPRRFRLVTAVWGTGLLVEAVGRTALALSLSTGVFLGVSFAWNAVILGGLFAWTVLFSRRAEERTRADMERLGIERPDLSALEGPA